MLKAAQVSQEVPMPSSDAQVWKRAYRRLAPGPGLPQWRGPPGPRDPEFSAQDRGGVVVEPLEGAAGGDGQSWPLRDSTLTPPLPPLSLILPPAAHSWPALGL